MRAFCVIVVLIFGISGAFGQPKETFQYRGQQYRLAVSFEVWKALPFWDSEKQQNPPLSAAIAVKEAFKFMHKLESQSGWSYYLDLRLRQPDANWLWEARWSRYRYVDGRREGDEQIRCWILMDGTVVEPVPVKQGEGSSETNSPAKASPPIRVETNKTSSAVAPRR